MRHMPDDSYSYIAHYMDHWSKFHILLPLMKKSADRVFMALVTISCDWATKDTSIRTMGKSLLMKL